MNVANAGAFTQLTAAELAAINGSASLFAAVQAAFLAAGGNTVFAFGGVGDTAASPTIMKPTPRSIKVMAS